MGCCSLDCFVYFVLSIALAFMAVSTTLPSPPDSNITKPNRPITHHHHHPLSLNASKALHQSNFKAITTLLHIYPEIFLSSFSSSSSPKTTLFAIDDSSLLNTSSLPPLFLKQLLQYHTLPQRLSMKDLLEKPQGTCLLPTLLRHHSVQISTVDKESRTAEVNHVMISHPDMFLGDSLVIHGVLGTFSPLQPHMDHIPHSSLCQSDTNKTVTEEGEAVPVKIDWTRIIQLLSSNGYVPFAIVLHSVLNMIIADQHKNLTGGVTILATPSLVSLSSVSPLLYEVMRRHILAQRLTNKELASMPDKALLKTLDPYQDLIITRRSVVNSSSQCLMMISGVEIVAPDMFSSSNFVIHGISHTLDIPRA
ncbi:Fasciclin-like arabinogalactan protein 21 [Raphanus sativus]|uniref:Fasciclin-like arabinogalactan protein 21 n=1 Tax=Raphanus sativus TaxID=3726 RepID=A0A6J0MT36_RAPSA|nr:fasciclin-like arabinogalactan protein 21 [Raphanus sativus]KAJ4908722.1 Fasciclin-like arabinogalactan protein 21 [Raphanus sativus]